MDDTQHKAKSFRWTPKKVSRLIKSIKNHPCIWNPANENYMQNQHCIPVYLTIKDQFPPDVTLASVKEKVKELRNLYITQLVVLKQNPDAPVNILWYMDAQFFSDGITDEEIDYILSDTKTQSTIEAKQLNTRLGFPKMCRVCLVTQQDEIDALEEYENLVTMFEQITGFKVIFGSDQCLPVHLCLVCKTSLLECHVFLERSRETEKTLQKVYGADNEETAMNLLTGIKIETEPDTMLVDFDLVDVKYFDPYEQPEKVKIKAEVPKSHDLSVEEEHFSKEFMQRNSSNSDREVEKSVFLKTKTRKTKEKKPKYVKITEPSTKEPVAKQPPIKESPDSICPFCGKTIKIKVRYHHFLICKMNPDANTNFLECDLCQKKFKRKYDIRKHIHMAHLNIIQRLKCLYCEDTFKYATDRLCHVRSKHMLNQPFPCQLCDKSYDMKYRLTNHIRTAHTKETPFECHVCGSKKSSSKALAAHIRLTHSSKPVVCEVCEKEFKNKKYLKQHERIHTGEKNFVCPVCEHRFKKILYMRQHVEKFHPGFEMPPKGAILSTRAIPLMLAMQEKEASYIKF